MDRINLNRIERIKYMEETLNEASEAVKELEGARKKYQRVKGRLDELSVYYGSREWHEDLSEE